MLSQPRRLEKMNQAPRYLTMEPWLHTDPDMDTDMTQIIMAMETEAVTGIDTMQMICMAIIMEVTTTVV